MVLITLHCDETWIRVKLVNTTLQRQLWNYGYANVTEHLTHEYITGPNRNAPSLHNSTDISV